MAHRKQDTMASGPASVGPEAGSRSSAGVGPSTGVGPSAGASPSAVADPEALGRQVCLRLLTVEPRTRAQLADAMRRRGVSEDVSDAILDRFTDAGLIDDAAFAKAWVESRHYARGLSRRSLSAELRRRGVDGDDIIEAVEALDPEQEIETARQLVVRKLRSTRGQPADARARRMASMLARKGYPAGLAFRLIREALEQEDSGSFAGSGDFDADGLEAELSEAEMSEVDPG